MENIDIDNKKLDEKEMAMVLGSFMNMEPVREINILKNEIKGIKAALQEVIKMLNELSGGKLDQMNKPEDEDFGVTTPMSAEKSQADIQSNMLENLQANMNTRQ